MAFSGALTLTDLNDFITPSQACIKPVEQTNPAQAKEAGAASTEIHIDATGSYYEVSADGLTSAQNSRNGAGTSSSANGRKLEQAQINLNDCLACSGCITSAESVLITLQSHVEVLNFLSENAKVDPSCLSYKLPVISIAPQSLASLAASLSAANPSHTPVTPRQVLRRVREFCITALGFSHVFDTTFARHLALREHVREFAERRARHGKEGPGAEPQLPMLASACPGWICYAEKAHAEMLPFIARTKSPQQVMGTLVKNWMGEKWGKLPSEIYHVAVMPCYDKKLEASRQDFYNEMYSTRDVDCVITTGELELMMKENGWDLARPVVGELEHRNISSPEPSTLLPELLRHEGSSSGSYLQAVIDHVRRTSQDPLTLTVQAMRNTDHEEHILRRSSTNGTAGEIVFKGAKCYGFRNLQNVVRKVGRESGVRVGGGAAGRLTGRGRRVVGVRRNRKGAEGGDGQPDEVDKERERGYDYVEVMACPGGCVNGGGQIRPAVKDAEGYQRDWSASGVAGDDGNVGSVVGGAPEVVQAKWGDKEWTRKVEEAYWRAATAPVLVPGSSDPDQIASLASSDACPKDASAGVACTLTDADRLARRVVEELCGPRSSSSPSTATRWVESSGNTNVSTENGLESSRAEEATSCDGAKGDRICGENDGLGVEGETEECRRKMFRTQYRAVESEVIGLAVKW
ncbi:hypothetical protein HGRIS_002110 [Hohenbuehelia grisea]|uniref:Iron hydrogenase large subunit C-terminal domain-containing protein n=1 Tax=Hohenbuehelia grisea TaxID=104357 RepID=A0ABR3JJH0_9AGAR